MVLPKMCVLQSSGVDMVDSGKCDMQASGCTNGIVRILTYQYLTCPVRFSCRQQQKSENNENLYFHVFLQLSMIQIYNEILGD